MQTCVRLDDRVYSGWFAAEQGLRQGCVLALILFKIFFAVVVNLAYARLKADKYIMDALVHLGKNKGTGGAGKINHRRSSAGDVTLGRAFVLTMPESYHNHSSS